jgi:hypothetical protein
MSFKHAALSKLPSASACGQPCLRQIGCTSRIISLRRFTCDDQTSNTRLSLIGIQFSERNWSLSSSKKTGMGHRQALGSSSSS